MFIISDICIFRSVVRNEFRLFLSKNRYGLIIYTIFYSLFLPYKQTIYYSPLHLLLIYSSLRNLQKEIRIGPPFSPYLCTSIDKQYHLTNLIEPK